jgi:hypothetical protein
VYLRLGSVSSWLLQKKKQRRTNTSSGRFAVPISLALPFVIFEIKFFSLYTYFILDQSE